PGLFTSEEVDRLIKEAQGFLAQASRALDLSDVPPVELEHRRLEASLLLKEVLDRLPLPEPDAIPGDAEVAKNTVSHWNIPGTELRIVRMAEGPRAGEYLFSRNTVRQINEFYEAIRDRPNQDGVG